jgi:hypothetical protein
MAEIDFHSFKTLIEIDQEVCSNQKAGRATFELRGQPLV